jgi:MinD-like ATPase involved in chromosome partitioning or flagellar assembly
MENTKEKEKRNPRVYTIHSQKGGVGKTSVAIAIAGFAAIFHNKKALIIDADLTGTSLIDIEGWSVNSEPEYFNDLILATPPEFADYTSNDSVRLKEESISKISKFYHKVLDYDRIWYMPASPCFNDVSKVVPLISQEDLLQFFQHRLEDIIETAIKDQFNVIVIDHPPGLFGISTASLRMVLSKKFSLRISGSSDISAQANLITTPDPVDHRALLPSFSEIIKRESSFKEPAALSNKINMILNKVARLKKRFDPPFEYQKILNETKDFPDGRKIDTQLIDILRDRAFKTGGLACGYISSFDMNEILPTIQNLKVAKRVDLVGMEGWCRQLAKSVGLWKNDEVTLP